jgi:hypothetical protein
MRRLDGFARILANANVI